MIFSPVSEDGTTLICMTEYLYQSLGDSSPLLTKFGCVTTTWTARTYYKEKPADKQSKS